MASRCSLYIQGVQHIIEEPIGWDAFATKLKRSEKAHGVAFEFSESALSFYGLAYTLIKQEYTLYGVNSKIQFKAEMQWVETGGFEEAYFGELDFKTYSENIGTYNSISINPAFQEFEATITNRQEQEVALNTTKAFDDTSLVPYGMLDKDVQMNPMEVKLISRAISVETEPTYSITAFAPYEGDQRTVGSAFVPCKGIDDERAPMIIPHQFICVVPNNPVLEELGTVSAFGAQGIKYPDIYSSSLLNYIPKVDVGDVIITGRIRATFRSYPSSIYADRYSGSNLSGCSMWIQNVGTIPLWVPESPLYFGCTEGNPREVVVDFSYSWTGAIPTNSQIALGFISGSIFIDVAPFSDDGTSLSVILHKETFFDIRGISTYNATNAKGAMIHESASRIIEAISDAKLAVKSDYYTRPDSDVVHPVTNESLAGAMGYGSMRALFNGYQIRQSLKSDGITKPYIAMTWKDMIEQLQAIDNVGFGIEYDEVQGNVVRIEDWRYFYKDVKIFEINSPAEKKRDINTGELYSKFECGFTTWEAEEFNGQDAFLTGRTYRTQTNLLDNTLSKMCKWIADGYAFEATRRKILARDTKDYKYDERVFIAVLADNGTNIVQPYQTRNGVVDDVNLISPLTVYNAMISPIRNAMKWMNKVLQIMSAGEVLQKGIKFLSGTGNFIAGGGVVNDGISDNGMQLIENADIEKLMYKHQEQYIPILKAETLKLEYPVSITEWKAIKAEPLGYILVDGERTYIKEMTYKFKDGKASFVLIPVFDEIPN